MTDDQAPDHEQNTRPTDEQVEAKALEWARRVFPHAEEHRYWNELIQGYSSEAAAYQADSGVATRLRQALRALERETFGKL